MPAMGSVLALTSAVLFAGAALVIRRGLAHSTPTTAALISISTNLVAMWLLSVLLGSVRAITLPAARLLLLAGIFAPGLARYTYYEAMTLIGVARASTLSNTTPLFTAVLAVPVLGERLSWGLAAGTILVVAGIALVARPEDAARVARPWAGTLLALNTAVMASISFMLRKLSLRLLPDPAAAAALTLTGSMLLLVPFALYRSRTEALRADRRGVVLLLGGALLTTAAFLAYFAALNLSEVVRVTPLANTTPVFALALLALFRQEETVRAGTVAGAVLTVAGVLLVVIG